MRMEEEIQQDYLVSPIRNLVTPLSVNDRGDSDSEIYKMNKSIRRDYNKYYDEENDNDTDRNGNNVNYLSQRLMSRRLGS